MAEISNQEIDNLQVRIQRLAEDGAVFKVDSVIGPRQIVVTQGSKLSAIESAAMPLIPVGIISYKELKASPFAIAADGKLSPILQPIEKDIDQFSTKLLPKGTNITIQLVPDSYFTQEELLKRATKAKGVFCVIYIPGRGNDTYQNIMVRNGMAVYDNREYGNLKDLFQAKGRIDRLLVEDLADSQILAIDDKKGFWDNKYAASQNISKIVEQLRIKTKQLPATQLAEEVEKIKKFEADRIKPGFSVEDRLIQRKKAIAEEKASYTRKYSNSSLGDQLSQKAKRYFPGANGEDIIKQIVAGLLPKSAMQIGALWSGIPTYEEEKAGLGAASHPVEIIEVRKDGDVRPILGQGFMSMVMGDRPPDEGLTFVLSVNSRGIETFIAPLVTQFRMDPIIPVRNLHLARFTRPIFSNKEFYSKIFGRLPDNLGKLVNKDGNYFVENQEDVRELSRALDLMYLIAPVYVAIKQIEVQNLNNNDGAFTVKINCGVADVTENYGFMPEYFRTIEDAFEIHQKRVKVVDRLRTEKAIRYIAKQVGAGAQVVTFGLNPDDLTAEDSLKVISEYRDEVRSKQKDLKTSSFVLRESKLVEIPSLVSATDAAAQVKGTASVSKDKVNFKKMLVYKPALGTRSNYNLLKTFIGCVDVRPGSQEIKEIISHFDLAHLSKSQIPIPAGPSTRYRNARVTKQDINSSAFMSIAQKVERTSIIDPKLVDGNPTSGLFAIRNTGMRAYKFGYNNWRDNSVIGLGDKNVLKPFELVAVRNIENSTITNMDVEYACALGMPIVSVEKKGTNYELQLLGVDTKNIADQANGTVIVDRKPLAFYEGNIRSINRSVGIIDLPDNDKYQQALQNIVANQDSTSAPKFCPETTATFNYAYTRPDKKNAKSSVQGTYGTLKFHNSQYRSLVTTSSKSLRDQISVKLDSQAQAATEFPRDTISQSIDFWPNVIRNKVLGQTEKAPLQFNVEYRTDGKKQKATIAFTDMLTSELGVNLYFFNDIKTNTPVVLRSSKYDDQLLSLIGSYIRDLKALGSKAPEPSTAKPPVKFGLGVAPFAPEKVSIASASNLKGKLVKIRNLVQSILNKQKTDLLEANDIPDGLTSLTQILASAKGFRGTHFLDESEPYVFSLMYQLNLIQSTKYDMTFKVRPDRVPYKDPGFIDENYLSMQMKIYREEPPKELDRNDAYTEQLRLNEEFIARVNNADALYSFITEQAMELIRTIAGVESPTGIDSLMKNPVYVVGAIQLVLLKYFDLLFSAHMLAKGAGVLVSKGVKIDLPDDANRKQQGLPDKDVEAKFAAERNFYKGKIQQIRAEITSKLRKSAKPIPFEEGDLFSKSEKDSLIKKEGSVEQISANVAGQLEKVVDSVYDRIYDSKTPAGQHFVSLENVKRILAFAGLDHPNQLSNNTTRLLDSLLSLFKQTVDILISKKQSQTLFTLKKGTIQINGSIINGMKSLNDSMQDLLAKVRAIRLATGNSIDFIKRKTLKLRKPIPQIGIIEEYGVSDPIRAPGRKKPTYQVIGGTSTQAYIQLHTNISELYINENSKIQDLIEEEEGIDAIYNVLREPSEITTVYNMLRSGRAMVRDAATFNAGSNVLFKTNATQDSLQNAFRLVKRSAINSANVDAYGTLLGMTQPHVEIIEPFFLALGLSKFVAKTTKISSGGETTSWKLDMYLLPYEAGYTTNRNLKKVNRSLTNQQFGDINAFVGAAYNPSVPPTLLKSSTIPDVNTSGAAAKKVSEQVGNITSYENKLISSRFAIAAAFSNLVALHAIYKAKQKVFAGIMDKSFSHPDDFKLKASNLDSATLKVFTDRRKSLVSELDLKSSDFTVSSNFGEIGLAGQIPVSVSVKKIGDAFSLGGTLGGAAGEFLIKKFKTPIVKAVGAGATRAVAKVAGFVTQASTIASALIDARASNVQINAQNAEILQANLRNNISTYVLLSQNFSVLAIEFLQDYFAEEANAPGSGAQFLELIAREAQSVVSNAGSLTGIAYFNNTQDESDTRVSTICGSFVSTYPVDSLIQKGTQESFFELNGQRIENISIVVVNSSISGNSDALAGNLAFETLQKDFYHYKKDDKKKVGSFFGDYYTAFGASNGRSRRTQIDICGEELLQLIIDGQAAIYNTDIYSIAMNPKFVAAESGLYNAVMQGVIGRLKVNHFAEYLLGAETLTIHANKINTLFDGAGSAIDRYNNYLGIKNTKGVLKKVLSAAQIKANYTNFSKESISQNLGILAETFPLANGRVIFNRLSDLFSFAYEIPAEQSFLKQNIYQFDSVLRLVNSLARQIYTQAPAGKRSSLPIPKLFNAVQYFGLDIGGSAGTDLIRDVPDSPDAYVIPGSDTDQTAQQSLSKLKDSTGKFTKDQIAFFWNEYRKNVIEHAVWLIDSYSSMLDGVSQSDMMKADPAYGLRTAVQTQLAINLASSYGISLEDANMQILSSSQQDLKELLTNTKANFESKDYQEIQKACDQIALYSNGNALGKQSLFQEYTVFLDTFKEVFLQIGYSTNSTGNIVKGFEDNSTYTPNSTSFSYLGRTTGDLWRNQDVHTIQFVERTVGLKRKEFQARSSTYRNVTGFGRYEPNVYYTLSDVRLDKESYTSVAKVHGFIKTFYGIERPEYIPAVLGVFQISAGKQLSFRRTDICLDMLSLYSMRFSQDWAEYFKKAGSIYLTGGAPPLSGRALLSALEVAGSFGLAVGTKNPLAGLVVAVVSFIVILIVQATFLSETPSLAGFNQSYMQSLVKRITGTKISTTPLFTAMKALLVLADEFNETDLVVMPVIGTQAQNATGTRTLYYVYPPEIDQGMEANEYIIQDTLSYLTLPLITKKQVTTVADVLSPGGTVIPDVKKLNENQQALASVLLVQEGFFKDHLEKLPEFIEIEKSKALALNAPGINTNPLEPQQGTQEHDWFQGTLRFITNMEGIYIGDASSKNIGNQLGTHLNFDVNGFNNFIVRTREQLLYIYKRLATEVLPGFGADYPADVLGRKFFSGIAAINAQARKLMQESALTAADVLWPKDLPTIASAKEEAKKKGITIVDGKPESYLSENAFYLSIRRPNGADNPKEYASFVNRALFISALFDDQLLTTTSALEKAGVADAKNLIDDSKNYLSGDYATWADASFGANTEPNLYFRYNSGKILEVRGNKRGQSFAEGSFEKSDTFIMREMSAEGRSLVRVNNAKEEEGFLISTLASPHLFNAREVFLARRSIITKNVLLSDRFFYIFNRRIDQNKVNKAKADGFVWTLAATSLRQQFANIADTKYMFIPAKMTTRPSFTFVEAYAAKLALDENFQAEGITVSWKHIFQAIEDIGDYLAYTGYAADFKNKAGGTVESSLYINKSDKVFEAPKGTSIGEFRQNNTISADTIAGVFAATSGLTSQYVMDKLEQYVDQQSSLQWDALGKASKEVRNTINAPLRMYPCAKLYFIRKERGGSVLYDDLYSYADILSVKVFETAKSPGNVIVIQLANNENKLENIIAAKDNARNPFEVKSRSQDQLSGLMLKAGTRIMVTLGYGNLITEENKFVAEIEQATPNPDGTYTITARGPGWVLNNPFSADAGVVPNPKDASTPGKTLSINGSQLLTGQMPATETDKNKVLLSNLANPQNAIARSLLLYGLLRLGNVSRYGRLGSILSEIAEDTSFALPDLNDEYTSLVQDGLIQNGFTVSSFIANLKDYVSKTFIGDLPQDSVQSYVNQAGDNANEVFKVNTFSKNILLSESYPAIDGLSASIGQWFINKYTQLQGNTVPEWKITNETYWEFIREVLLTIPNSKSYVRTYETDGSLIIGGADEYYTMYKSKSYVARMANTVFRNLAALKETNSVIDILKRFVSVVGSVSAKPEQEAIEMIAEVLTGVISTLAFNEVDRAFVSALIKRVSDATFPLPVIENQSASNISELFTQLKNTTTQTYILTELLSVMLGSTLPDSKKDITDSLYKSIIGGLIPGGSLTVSAVDLYFKASNAAASKEGMAALGDPRTVLAQPVSVRYKLIRDLLNLFMGNLANAPDSTKKLLEMAMQLSFSSKIDPSTITAIKEQVDVASSSSALSKRVLFTFALCVCRAFSNKMHKIRTLTPDKRKVQESYYMFSGRDIVHNAASTMLGYNEGEFVFDEISATTGESSGASNLPVLGLLGSLFGSKITRFGFAVDPVSSESGGTGDYSAKRLIVNLNNPAYFSAFMGIGNYGANDKKGPILTVLSIMATSQMQEMVKDWYGGEIVTYGDSEKKSNDVVFMYDYIRDMYGPFEIKEAIHSFDGFGFLSTYTPSVYTRSEPRNITDETDGAGASLVGNLILGGIGAVGLYKSRGVLGKILGKIPGLGKTLTKFNISVAKGIGSLVESQVLSKNPLKMARGAFAFGAGKVGQGAMWLARRIVIDPIIKNSDYARVAARATAGKYIKTLEVGVKDTLDAFAKANGFQDAKILGNYIKDSSTVFKEGKVFKDARAFFLANPTEEIFKIPGMSISKKAMGDIDSLMSQLFDQNSGGLIHSLINGEKVVAKQTAVIERLRKSLSTLGIDSSTITADLMGTEITALRKIKGFTHFLEGKTFETRIVKDIAGVTSISSIQLALKGADEATVSSLTNLTLDELRAINQGKNYAKSPVVFSKAADNFAVNLSDNAVADMQVAIASTTDPELQARAVGRFVSEMERLAAGSTNKAAQVITVNQTKIRVTSQDIANFRELISVRNNTSAAMHESITTKLGSIQKELANKEIPFKDLSSEAKAAITEAGETFTSASQQQLKGVRADLNKLEQRLRAAQSSTVEGKALAEQLQAEKAELKRKISEIETTASSFKKNLDSDIVRDQAAKNLGDSLKKDAAKLKDATAAIGNDNLNAIKGDKLTARILSSTAEGKHQQAGYNTLANITREGASTRFSKNPVNSIGSIVKGLTTLFSIYQVYGLVRDTIGESITEYRLLLGKQAAANSLITEFMVYKGEPFLSNLEGITRNSSKLITGETSYLDYLKSRFYSATEISDFLRTQYSSIVSTALTQYTDQLITTNIDTGLYHSLDSDIGFNKAGGFAGDNFGSTLNKVDNLGNPENLVSLFHPNKFIIGTGFYDKGADGKQHNGVDIGTSKFTKSTNPSDLAASNGVYAIESGFALAETSHDFATIDRSRQAGYGIRDNAGNPVNSAAITSGGIRVIVFGLETGIVWWNSHTFPNIGSTGFDDALLQSSKKVQPVLSSERVGMCGPWGATSGPHVHLEAYQIKSPEFDQARKIYTEGKAKGLTVKTNTDLIAYFNKNYKKIRATVTNSVRVPPEEIFNKTTLVSQWGNKKK